MPTLPNIGLPSVDDLCAFIHAANSMIDPRR
jgi:hypothetical protein